MSKQKEVKLLKKPKEKQFHWYIMIIRLSDGQKAKIVLTTKKRIYLQYCRNENIIEYRCCNSFLEAYSDRSRYNCK